MRAALFITLLVTAAASCKSKKTAEHKDAAVAAPETTAALVNVKATELLFNVIIDRYSHRDQQKVDWPSRFDEFRSKLEGASGTAEFAKLTAELLAVAKDTHISVTAVGTAKPIPTYRPPLEFNIDIEIIGKRVKGIRDVDRCISVGTLDKRTGYLLLRSFTRQNCPRFAAGFDVAFNEIKKLPRLIIDHRGNTGGDETLARIVAARFLDGDTIYAHTELGPPRDGPSKRFPRKLVGAIEGQRYTGDVRVLIGGGNLSSAEAFVLMMKHAKKAKLVGARTFGSSGNPKGVILGNGVTVNLPSWRTFDGDGNPIEGEGIEPDIPVAWPKPARTDTVLDAALASF